MAKNIPAPQDHIIYSVVDRLDSLPDSHAWKRAADIITTGAGASAKGTLRRWCEDHNGMGVDTWQVQPLRSWVPGTRILSASASYATFDGSRQDYAGTTVIHADDSMVIYTYDWGGPAYVVHSVAAQ